MWIKSYYSVMKEFFLGKQEILMPCYGCSKPKVFIEDFLSQLWSQYILYLQ